MVQMHNNGASPHSLNTKRTGHGTCSISFNPHNSPQGRRQEPLRESAAAKEYKITQASSVKAELKCTSFLI